MPLTCVKHCRDKRPAIRQNAAFDSPVPENQSASGLTAQQAYGRLKGQQEESSEKSVPVLMPLSVREELGSLAKARQMKKGEFLDQFMLAALHAYKQGAFEVD